MAASQVGTNPSYMSPERQPFLEVKYMPDAGPVNTYKHLLCHIGTVFAGLHDHYSALCKLERLEEAVPVHVTSSSRRILISLGAVIVSIA